MLSPCTGEAGRRIDVISIIHHGGASLDVEPRIVPSIANLPGEKAEGVDARAVSLRRSQRADVVAREVGPIGLGLYAEHPIDRLPAIAEQATGGSICRVVAAFIADSTSAGDEISAIMA